MVQYAPVLWQAIRPPSSPPSSINTAQEQCVMRRLVETFYLRALIASRWTAGLNRHGECQKLLTRHAKKEYNVNK